MILKHISGTYKQEEQAYRLQGTKQYKYKKVVLIMESYTQIKQDIENRLAEIGNDLTKQKYPDEVNMLLCNYRTLKEYDTALDSSYCHDGLEISYRLNCVLA